MLRVRHVLRDDEPSQFVYPSQCFIWRLTYIKSLPRIPRVILRVGKTKLIDFEQSICKKECHISAVISSHQILTFTNIELSVTGHWSCWITFFVRSQHFESLCCIMKSWTQSNILCQHTVNLSNIVVKPGSSNFYNVVVYLVWFFIILFSLLFTSQLDQC